MRYNVLPLVVLNVTGQFFRRIFVGERKKMPNIELKNFKPQSVIDSSLAFTMPRVTYGINDVVLSFYAFDNQIGKLRRKRIKLNHLGKRWFIKRREKEICARFIALLAQGWTPFKDGGGAVLPRLKPQKTLVAHSVSLQEAVKRHNDYVTAEVERKVMSDATRKTYHAYSKRLLGFMPSILIGDVTTSVLVSFVDSLKAENKSPKYCNSIIGWLKTIFGWFLERGLVNDNPASPIKTETLSRQQGRPTMTIEEHEKLFRLLREKGYKEFLLACMMEYYTYIRPNELYRVKVRYINFSEQSLTVPAEISKNRKTAKVALPTVVVNLMRELGIDRHKGDDYVFGERMKCCAKIGNPKQFGRFWSRHVVCEGGIFPELGKYGVVFYSLKNSGITDMLARGIPSAVVRDQARHQDLSTTEIYGRTSQTKAPEGLRNYE